MSEIFVNDEKEDKLTSENEIVDGKDRLSSLPDSIIADEILSLLPIECAVKTSALSRRWRHLWTQVSRLHFSWHHLTKSRRDDFEASFYFYTTVDHIIRHLTASKISSFYLHFHNNRFHGIDKELSFSYVDAWIRRICAKNPEEIYFGHAGFSGKFPLPSCIFECQSLVMLDLCLDGSFDYKLPDSGIISLPNLKELNIFVFDSDRDVMKTLFKSCPSLEQLHIGMFVMEDGNYVDIFGQNLKRLSIYIVGDFCCNEFVIHAPKLECITFQKRYTSSIIRFVSIPSALIEVDLGTIDPDEDAVLYGSDHLGKSLELLRGISTTRSLDIIASLFCALNYVDDSVRPIFHNLTFLTIRLDDPSVFDKFLDTIHYTPSLKDLVISNEFVVVPGIDWGVLDSVPACLLSKLERIRIWDLDGTDEELWFLKYILSNANVLEKLHVCIRRYKEIELGEEAELCKRLFRYPRGSSTCEIDFSGNYLSASSTNFKGTSLECELLFCD